MRVEGTGVRNQGSGDGEQSPQNLKPETQNLLSIDHVQITIPIGQEQIARTFYSGVLGLTEIEKPDALKGRGGLWLEVGGQQLHIGVENGIDRASSKAHVAYRVLDLARWRAKLEEAGCFILESVPIPNHDRFETRDPFGNRIELIAKHEKDH